MKPVVVLIPTFQRPDSLTRAVASVLAQEGLSDLVEEIAVVDNDPAGSAREAVDMLQRTGAPIRYIHAREPGVSNARNAGLAATSAPLVAFLDDDEEAPPHWIAALYAAHKTFAADVTFGPVRGRADSATEWKRAYLDGFFSRTGPAETGPTETVHGCGNSMMTRATALAGPAPFDLRANETGGEDDRLFERLKGEDRRFAWAAEAWVYEHAPESRATVHYALSRALGYGQTPAQIAARAKAWPRVALWMVVGLAQAVLFGAVALALFAVSRTRALPYADRAARGLGKVIWFRKLKFYGQRPKARRGSASSSATDGAASRIAKAAKITHSRSL